MLRTRVLTVVLAAPPFLFCLWQGAALWTVLVAVLAGVAAVEAARMGTGEAGSLPVAVAAVLAAGLVLLPAGMLPGLRPVTGAGGSGLTPGPGPAGPLLLGATLVVLLVMTADAALYPAGVRAPVMLQAVLYPGLGFAHLLLLRQAPEGLRWTLFLLVAVWSADIAAYFAGLAWGRHRLAPRVSPGKSWEGAVAGLLVGAVVGGASGPLLGLGWPRGALLGCALAVAGLTGDLAESALKRAAGRKDSGRLVPGHGGVLDRFDSVLFAAPVLYWWRVLGGM